MRTEVFDEPEDYGERRGRHSGSTSGIKLLPLYGLLPFTPLTRCENIHSDPDGIRPLQDYEYCECGGCVGNQNHPVFSPNAIDWEGRRDTVSRLVASAAKFSESRP